MKKKISLAIIMAMLTSAFVSFATVASAATDPRIVITATEVDFTDAAYSAYAGDDDVDWRAYQDEAVGEYKTYDIAVALTGLEIGTTQNGTGRSAKYPGSCLTSATIAFTPSGTWGTYGVDWKAKVISTLISGAQTKADETGIGVGDSNTSPVYPAKKEAKTINSTDVSPAIFHALVVVDTGYTLTFTASNADIIIGQYDTDNSAAVYDSYTEYASATSTFSLAGASITLPLAPTYTITFKTFDGNSVVEEQTVAEGDTITPPTAPAREGFTFAYWSEAQDGDEATIGTAAADKTYYAVYNEDAPAEETIAPVENKVDAQNIGTTALTDLSGKPVGEFKKNYGIAKFDAAITTGEKDYYIVATDDKTPEPETKEWKITFSDLGVEAENANVSFFALVKSATHKIVSVELKARTK